MRREDSESHFPMESVRQVKKTTIDLQFIVNQQILLIDPIMFDLDLQEHIDFEQPVPEFKAGNSTTYTRGQFSPFSPFSPHPQGFSAFPPPMDFSLDNHLQANNVQTLKKAIIAYLKHCLAHPIDEATILQQVVPTSLPSLSDLENEDDCDLQVLITANPLLSASRRKKLLQNFKEFDELKGLFSQLRTTFGKTISQEIAYVLTTVFEVKIDRLRTLLNRQSEPFLPRFDRFHGDNGEENPLPGGWEIFEEVGYDQVKTCASECLQGLASQLYYSSQLKFLTLSETPSLKPNLNLLDKFTHLLAFASENAFLSIAGMSHQQADLLEFTTNLRYLRTNQRLEEESLSKRIKLF